MDAVVVTKVVVLLATPLLVAAVQAAAGYRSLQRQGDRRRSWHGWRTPVEWSTAGAERLFANPGDLCLTMGPRAWLLLIVATFPHNGRSIFVPLAAAWSLGVLATDLIVDAHNAQRGKSLIVLAAFGVFVVQLFLEPTDRTMAIAGLIVLASLWSLVRTNARTAGPQYHYHIIVVGFSVAMTVALSSTLFPLSEALGVVVAVGALVWTQTFVMPARYLVHLAVSIVAQLLFLRLGLM